MRGRRYATHYRDGHSDGPPPARDPNAGKPRELDARYPGTCSGCGARFDAGTRVYWSRRGDGSSSTRVVDCAGCRGEAPKPAARVRGYECRSNGVGFAAKVGDGIDGIVELIERAREHLKYPKIRLRLDDGTPVVVGRAGDRARFPGTLNVTDGGRYGESRWFGRVHQDGQFKSGREARGIEADIARLLARFAADPAGTAAEYGRLTGNCCFCGRRLEDERSTAVGYGKTCAGHYGLPWGVLVATADGETHERVRQIRRLARRGREEKAAAGDEAEALVNGDAL